jgi:hypothetical protein
MKFEEALKAMREGKRIKRKTWNDSEGLVMYKNSMFTCPFLTPCNVLATGDLCAPDWEICEEESPKPKEAEKEAKENVPFLTDEDKNILSKLAKEKIKREVPFNRLEITFKSGETIAYNSGEWDDYAYDGKAVIVKRNGAWIGIYNFADVFCVELK